MATRRPQHQLVPTPSKARGIVFSGYYRNLPHWRLKGAIYFVTWRIHPQQPDLTENERTELLSVLHHFNGRRYGLLAWVVMNDHVHVLVQLNSGFQLETVIHSWKSFSARLFQQRFGRKGSLWMREYFDRVVRNDKEYEQKRWYILNNPYKRWPNLTTYRWAGDHTSVQENGSSPAQRPEPLSRNPQ